MTYSNYEICQIIDCEGLDYTIMIYLSPKKIEDPKTKQLFIVAKQNLQDILNHLKYNEYLEPSE